MRMRTKIRTTVVGIAAVAAMALTGLPAANADTSMVSCTSNAFYHTIKTNGDAYCFANPGDIYVNVLDTITLKTGNNFGWVAYKSIYGGQQSSPKRPKYYTGSFSSPLWVQVVSLRAS